MNLKDIHSVYFIGIGGIGMSALARYFKYIGREVAGYDRTSSPITDQLIEKGIVVHFEDAVEKIPRGFYPTRNFGCLHSGSAIQLIRN